jgi:hypothetical protein
LIWISEVLIAVPTALVVRANVKRDFELQDRGSGDTREKEKEEEIFETKEEG